MTDALAAWALQHEEENTPVWETLCKVSEDDFKSLVKNARNSTPRMKTDDTTLLAISFDDEESDEATLGFFARGWREIKNLWAQS